jgi:hypothetical protein
LQNRALKSQTGSSEFNEMTATSHIPATRWVGLAGEHYVAMQVALEGVKPLLHEPTADLVATRHGRSVTIEVKAMGEHGRYMVDLPADEIATVDFLVVVELNLAGTGKYTRPRHGDPGAGIDGPFAYVLPRETAQEVVALGGDNHATRPAVNLRKAHHMLGPYLNAWHLITDALG